MQNVSANVERFTTFSFWVRSPFRTGDRQTGCNAYFFLLSWITMSLSSFIKTSHTYV